MAAGMVVEMVEGRPAAAACQQEHPAGVYQPLAGA